MENAEDGRRSLLRKCLNLRALRDLPGFYIIPGGMIVWESSVRSAMFIEDAP